MIHILIEFVAKYKMSQSRRKSFIIYDGVEFSSQIEVWYDKIWKV